jgi:hypothetical protein
MELEFDDGERHRARGSLVWLEGHGAVVKASPRLERHVAGLAAAFKHGKDGFVPVKFDYAVETLLKVGDRVAIVTPGNAFPEKWIALLGQAAPELSGETGTDLRSVRMMECGLDREASGEEGDRDQGGDG